MNDKSTPPRERPKPISRKTYGAKMRQKIRGRERVPVNPELGTRHSLQAMGASFMVASLFAAVVVGILSIGAVKKSSDYFTETGIRQNSVSTWISVKGGSNCIVFGTFGGASVIFETQIRGTSASTDAGSYSIEDDAVVCPAAYNLAGIRTSTGWIPATLGFGAYRIKVTGGDVTTDLTVHCRVSSS